MAVGHRIERSAKQQTATVVVAIPVDVVVAIPVVVVAAADEKRVQSLQQLYKRSDGTMRVSEN